MPIQALQAFDASKFTHITRYQRRLIAQYHRRNQGIVRTDRCSRSLELGTNPGDKPKRP